MIPVQQLLDFSGQVVLVTGAGRGLGSAIARRFAQTGARVVLHYHASQEDALALAAELDTTALRADLTQESGVQDLLASVRDRFGPLHVLVNNAGVYPVQPLLEMTAADWEDVLAANLRSAFLTTQAAAGHMVQPGKNAVIINIASIEARHPAPGHSHYAAAKAGLLALTRAAALELGQQGIRVNAVSPGLVWRPGIEQDWPQGVAAWQAAAPLARLGQPEEVADACLFLASRMARWITGIDLLVDGGISARSLF